MEQKKIFQLLDKIKKVDKIKIGINESLNIFNLISPKYRKEEFHSAVLAGLLSKKSSREDEVTLMTLFIDCLNKSRDGKIPINKEDFKDYDIKCEEKKIDILIIGDDGKGKRSVIIIENKINGARDQGNQIPRYYDKVQNELGIPTEDIKAIVYLPSLYKKPDKAKWSEKISDDKKTEIWEKLIVLPSVDATNKYSLLKDWIKEALYKIDDLNTHFILKQYKELIEEMAKDKLALEKSKEMLNFLRKENAYDDFLKRKDTSLDLSESDDSLLEESFRRIPEVLADECFINFSFDEYYSNLESAISKRGKTYLPYFKCRNPIDANHIIPQVIRISFNLKKKKSFIHLWPDNTGKGDLNRVKLFLDEWKLSVDHKFKEHSNKDVNEYFRKFDFPAQYEEMKNFINNDLIGRLEEVTKDTIESSLT